ncbi:MAG TPA: malto-oligosyltrehalose trehalohydrolase [Candidatus Polarisedimenticolia bacterium]|nr:malto-oligosyltrehalose trehalohydrolase [Candidatus Polarisedimenticolia bacterium]
MLPLGATPRPDGGCGFRVWAPRARAVEAVIVSQAGRAIRLEAQEHGHHAGLAEGVGPGDTYLFRLDGGGPYPDPASQLQPDGVHGPSQVVGPPPGGWDAPAWRGPEPAGCVLYEMHVGTFTPEGTLDAAARRLEALADLGVTVIQLMPIHPFPGQRNWGYDAVYPHAVHAAYGGPEGLRRFTAACHGLGLAVALDVIYNHLGPEGNYLERFGDYVSTRHRTPWGNAINFDGPGSDEVREYFIQSALRWVEDHHVDMLRLDAVHGIVDTSARPFLAELSARVRQSASRAGRRVLLIAESDLNDPRLVRPESEGGCALDGQWNDDFHHALHALLTGERSGYYADYGEVEHLERSLREGFVLSGQRSLHRGRRHGADGSGIPPHRLVVFAQNHDQVGNRMAGERLSSLVSPGAARLAAAAVVFSPFLPLLFMGEEYAEPSPFQYFVSHADAALIEAVRRGRREEFAAFAWPGEAPDPQDEATFLRCKLRWELREAPGHRDMLAFYRQALALRRGHPALSAPTREGMLTGRGAEGRLLWVRRGAGGEEALIVMNFDPRPAALDPPAPARGWRLLLDSSDGRWGGPGAAAPQRIGMVAREPIVLAPESVVVYA